MLVLEIGILGKSLLAREVAAGASFLRSDHRIATEIRFLPGTVDPMAYWIKGE